MIGVTVRGRRDMEMADSDYCDEEEAVWSSAAPPAAACAFGLRCELRLFHSLPAGLSPVPPAR